MKEKPKMKPMHIINYKKYMDMITKNGKLLVDSNGNRTNKGQGLTREARIQEDIIRFFIKMREKEFFEKGVSK